MPIHEVLQKNDIDYLMFTAGKFKRTITTLTETSDEARAKFQSELEEIHVAFSQHVDSNRGHLLDTDAVSTGEAWLALAALEKGLVDELMTSEEYVRMAMGQGDVIEVKPHTKKNNSLQWIQQFTSDTLASVRSLLPVNTLLNESTALGIENAKFEAVRDVNVFK